MASTPPITTENEGGGAPSDGAAGEQVSILDRLVRVESLLGIGGGGEQGVVARLTKLETRLGKLEDAVGMFEGATKEPTKAAAGAKDESTHYKAPKTKTSPNVEQTKATTSAKTEATLENTAMEVVQTAVSNESVDERDDSEAKEQASTCSVAAINVDARISGCGCEVEMANRIHSKLRAFARHEIFKWMKFLPPNDKDLFSIEEGTVGYVIVREFKIEKHLQQLWWSHHAGIVQLAIVGRRNEVSNDIKRTVRDLLLENPVIGTAGCKVPSLERILKLRNDEEAFTFLVDHIFGCVSGDKRGWKDRKIRKEAREVLSVSDEAFALVVLENNWNLLTKTSHGARVEARYTGRRSFGKDDGWSSLGLKRFNALYEMVNMDRATKRKVDARVRDSLFQKYYEAKVASEQKRKRESSERIERELAAWRETKRQAFEQGQFLR